MPLPTQEMFHREAGSGAEVKAARIAEVLAAIDRDGTYEHTAAELEMGARLAWRHAPKWVLPRSGSPVHVRFRDCDGI